MTRLDRDVRGFVALVAGGRSLEAMERFYADDVELRENYEAPRVGKQLNLEHERRNLATLVEPPRAVARAIAIDEAACVSMIEWEITFLPLGRRRMRLEEVARQRWRDGKIVAERFFYEKIIDGE
jgi:hypothetical protein